MAGICSIHRGFSSDCKLCRSIFREEGLEIFCVTGGLQIETFLTLKEAQEFVNQSENRASLVIEPTKVRL